jgi:hypothetical protein
MAVSYEEFKSLIRPEGTIDPARAETIKAKVTEALDNPRFWDNENRIQRLEDALSIPEYNNDYRMLIHFAQNSINAEYMAAKKRGETPEEPTEEGIFRRAYDRHLVKVAEEKVKQKNRP